MQRIQVVPEAGLGPEQLCPRLLGWDEGKKHFTGETNVGRVHKTLLRFLSCLPRRGNFLEPSLGPPHWGAGASSGAGLRGCSSSQEGEGAERIWGGGRGIFMIINADATWIYYKDGLLCILLPPGRATFAFSYLQETSINSSEKGYTVERALLWPPALEAGYFWQRCGVEPQGTPPPGN